VVANLRFELRTNGVMIPSQSIRHNKLQHIKTKESVH
jgi:hypothetical protein